MTLFHHLFCAVIFVKLQQKKAHPEEVPIPASATTPQIRAQPECAVTIFYGHADLNMGFVLRRCLK